MAPSTERTVPVYSNGNVINSDTPYVNRSLQLFVKNDGSPYYDDTSNVAEVKNNLRTFWITISLY